MGFSVGARLDDRVRAAIRIAHSHADVWVAAVGQDGQVRDGAHVTEITALVDVSAYPAGTRVLVRREPLHPGRAADVGRVITLLLGFCRVRTVRVEGGER